MAETREQSRRQRAEARERRRSLLAQPFEALDEKTESAAEAVGLGDGHDVSPVAKTAVAATAAAVAGGLAGAAKAVIERRRREDDGERDEAEREPRADAEDEPEAEARSEPESETESEPEAEAESEPEAEAESEPEAEAEPESETESETEPEAESASEPEAEAEADEEREPADEAEDEDEPQASAAEDESAAAEEDEDEGDEARADGDGGSGGDLRRVIETARQQLQELVGTEAETVSSIERVDEGWRVSLEAVELRRVPDSTDVLCSYDVVLGGDDCSVVSLERTRRYRRAQVDGE